MMIPVISQRKMENPYMNFPHLVERMQLITILTVGELVIAVIKTYSLADNFLLSVCSFLIVGFLFVSYVSQTVIGIDHHQKRVGIPLVYLHIGILIAINIITAGVEMFHNGELFESGVIFILIGISLFYVCLFGTSRYKKEALIVSRKAAFQYLLVSVVGLVLQFYLKRMFCYSILYWLWKLG